MSTSQVRRWPGTPAVVAFTAAVVAHLLGLYLPEVDSPDGLDVPGQDKVAHILLFGVVMVTGRLAGLAAGPLAGALLVHAGVSELIQHALLPRRSGDPLDVVADVAGIALGWYVSGLVLRHRSTG